MTYAELAALPASAYLNPSLFRTEMDSLPEKGYAEKRYQEALSLGREPGMVITINARSVWSGRASNRSAQSYEGIGYHSCTASVLQGFLNSGCEIMVLRSDGSATKIQ